jgi:hypothetical protein
MPVALRHSQKGCTAGQVGGALKRKTDEEEGGEEEEEPLSKRARPEL